jgi:hypothetical protein
MNILTYDPEPRPARAVPRDLVFELSRIYLLAGLAPADALRSALADFDCFFEPVATPELCAA